MIVLLSTNRMREEVRACPVTCQRLGHQLVESARVQVRRDRHRAAFVGGLDDAVEPFSGIDRDEADLQYLQATCANPKCDEQFLGAVGPGRRKDFHSEECRRTAEREHRRIASLLEHYNRQADQMRARMAAYLRTNGDGELNALGPSAAELDRARVVIAEVRGMARFLQNHQEDFAQDLLRLLEAVEPLVRSPQLK